MDLYLLVFIEMALNLAAGIGKTLTICSTLATLLYLILRALYAFDNEKWDGWSADKFAKVLAPFVIMALLMQAAPSKELVYTVMAADYLADTTELDKLPPKVVQSLNKYLDEYLQEPDQQ